MSSTPSAPEVFALVDCNSFFCSCERVFAPHLKKKPVIVLSNNDGCAVSLTPEARALGIPMGAPYFKYKDIIEKNHVHIFSSNYVLYTDMSARVMSTLAEFTPELEIYSVDEAFLSLKGFEARGLTEYGLEIKKTVYQYTGIPVSIGIAPTKVLAKLANRVAKKSGSGVLSLMDETVREKTMQDFPVEDLWGIGFRSAEKLKRLGIYTALQLRDASEKTVRSILTVVGHRILKELKGVSCLELEQEASSKKQILSSRSFGRGICDLETIQEAVSSHATRVAQKLRRQKSVCFSLQVFLHTNRYKNTAQYFNMSTRTFLTGLQTTNHLISEAKAAMEEIYREGFEYKKCGVLLSEIHPETENQQSLFDQKNSEKFENVMKLMDRMNEKMGTDTLKFASCGIKKHWRMRSEKRSSHFTTKWADVIRLKI